ncbi:uncharacterized protein RHOBADRAFT_46225 [Rhodotorula graminis WP1]|uniref:Myb-like domain-containing protein n=1 Tax=Rhodotorula graminis (strain WP1) TaxID=578459 RepID=A0A0P9H041_RHOGW|nr:uncharacterized protein RHOBADRAFT_46225 [Rhodotorula graminis WP1]KPV73123.1 hypothetical protein RHOBADRAFT_46225 [Rhodotorula graminis WP1]
MAGPDSSGEGEDSYEEAEQDGYLEPVRSLGLAGKRRRSSSSSAERPVHQRRHSDSHEPKPSRHAAPVSTTSYRDGHALSLGFPSTWTPVDDVVLVSTVETMNEEATRRGEGVDWASVAEALPGTRRTRRQVEGRWNALVQQVSEALSYLDDDPPQPSEPESDGSSPSTTATPWTTDEDARLVAAVKHHSPWSAAQPMNAVLASTAASASSSRSAWPAVKARFDSLVAEGEPGPARTAADLAEQWRTLQYTAGAHRTRRAQAEAAVELERAEWTPHELAHLVDVVIGLGGSVERNAAGWEGEVKATSRWMQVLHGLGKQTSLVDVCLAWCEAKDGSAGSPASLVASSTSRSSTPVVAAESFKREPSPPTASTSTSTHPSSSLATAQLPPLPTRLLSTTTSSERASGRMYTAEEDAIIIADRRAGVKQSITARRLKRPLSGIRGRVKALRKKGVIVDERPGRAQ